MPAHPTTSEVFQCRYCASDVALVVLPGGELAYECVSARCGHTVHVDCPEALDLKPEPADIAADAAEAFDALAPRSPAEQRAADKAEYRLALGVRLAKARDAILVPSATTAGTVYRVENGRCNCKAGQAGRPCWHVQAARRAA